MISPAPRVGRIRSTDAREQRLGCSSGEQRDLSGADPLDGYPAHRTAFVEDVQFGVERERVELGAVDLIDVRDLVSGFALVREDAVEDAETGRAFEPYSEFFHELSMECFLGALAELDAAADRAEEVQADEVVTSEESEDVTVFHREADADVPDYRNGNTVVDRFRSSRR